MPKKLLKRVEAVCRAFLWKGIVEFDGPGMVDWKKVCSPKKNGGLGVRRVCEWNIAAVGKYVWDIAQKKDCLFVKWIHSVYLIDENWWDYQAQNNAS